MEFENGQETLDAESGKVASMLRALPRVEAPANFEFGVKAKISRGAIAGGGLIGFLKLAAPLSLILAIGAFAVYYATLPGDPGVATLNNTPAADTNVTQPAPVSGAVEPVTASGTQEPEAVEPQREVVAGGPGKSDPARRTSGPREDTNSGGGSVDIIQRSARVIMPPGTNSANPRNRTLNSNTATSSDTPVVDILGIHGITADFAGGGWRVISVADHSIAARLGVRKNDVIEAINGQELTKDTKLKGEAGTKAFRVRRDGKRLELKLQN